MGRANDISFINFDAFTNTPTCRLVDSKGLIWDDTNAELAVAPTYANTLITLAEDTNINGVPVRFPAGLPTGDYHLLFYDDAAPDATTAYSRWWLIAWNSESREITCFRDMMPMS